MATHKTSAKWLFLLVLATGISGCWWRKSTAEAAKDTVIEYLNSADFEGPIVTFEAVRWSETQPWRQRDENRTEALRLRKEASRGGASSRHRQQQADSLERVPDTTQVARAIFIVYRMSPGTSPLDSAWFAVWPDGRVAFVSAPSRQPAAPPTPGS